MKGVIVQIGEPKSVVLFNNGKIRAIPTPADCRVGMVVSVKLNDRLRIVAIICAAVFLLALGAFLGGAFRTSGMPRLFQTAPVPAAPVSALPEARGEASGSGYIAEHGRRTYRATVEQAKTLPDDTRVTLSGNIVEFLDDDKYLFRDSSGDIIVEIERKLWRDFSVTASDTVEISGEVDIERQRVTIDVKNIKKN